MKNIYFVLLSLTLFVAIVTSQSLQACLNAQSELADNQRCSNAIREISNSLDDSSVVVSNDELNSFCLSTCRSLNLQVSRNCADEVSKLFVCIIKLVSYINVALTLAMLTEN